MSCESRYSSMLAVAWYAYWRRIYARRRRSPSHLPPIRFHVMTLHDTDSARHWVYLSYIYRYMVSIYKQDCDSHKARETDLHRCSCGSRVIHADPPAGSSIPTRVG